MPRCCLKPEICTKYSMTRTDLVAPYQAILIWRVRNQVHLARGLDPPGPCITPDTSESCGWGSIKWCGMILKEMQDH